MPDLPAGDPIRRLCESHREIERYLSSMIRIAKESHDGPVREPAMFAAALRYFRAIAPGHTADEEESLFPRLRRTRHPATTEALRQLETLEEEHGCADRAHDEADRLSGLWLVSGRLSAGQTARLAAVLEGLADLYRRHMQLEEREIFPLAVRMLPPTDLESLGAEMTERRTGRNPK